MVVVAIGFRGVDRPDAATFMCTPCFRGVDVDEVTQLLSAGGLVPVVSVRAVA